MLFHVVHDFMSFPLLSLISTVEQNENAYSHIK